MTRILVAIALFGVTSKLSAQVSEQPVPGRPGCAYIGAPEAGVHYDLGRRDAEFERTTNELLQAFGFFGTSIQLLPASARYQGVAEARIWIENDEIRKALVYNPDAIQLRGRKLNAVWPAYAIAAHELGHLINDHGFRASISREEMWKRELIADRASGFALRILGAPLASALDILKIERGSGPNHPPTADRLASVRQGWTQGDAQLQSAAKQPEARFARTELHFSVAVTLYDGADAIPDGLPVAVEIALYDREGQRLDGSFEDPVVTNWKHVRGFPSFEARLRRYPANPRVHFDASDLRLLDRIELKASAPASQPWSDTTAQRRLNPSCLRGVLKIEALDPGGNREPLLETGFESICWRWGHELQPGETVPINQGLKFAYRNMRWHESFRRAAGLIP